MCKVYAKILEIQKVVRGLSKDSQAYGYGYVSGDKLLGVIRPKMDELGLLLLPSVDNVTITPTTYSAFDRKLNRVVEKTENLTVLDMTMTWVDAESGDTLAVQWKGVGQNGFDKGFGSALTYAERYYLLKTFHLSTNEDDVDAVNAVRDEAMEGAARLIGTTNPTAAAQASDRPEPAPEQPARGLKPLPELPAFKKALRDESTEFHAWAALGARGGLSKQGLPARDAFARKFAVSPEHIRAFDAFVSELAGMMNNNHGDTAA